jgi:hypothetical protein
LVVGVLAARPVAPSRAIPGKGTTTMKTLLALATMILATTLSGCVSVHEREPDTTTTTTRHTTLSAPATTTVERTTVY